MSQMIKASLWIMAIALMSIAGEGFWYILHQTSITIDSGWVGAIANVVIALGVIVAVFQFLMSKKQLQKDHERSRRERAVELIQTWTTQINQKATLARKLIECLDESQVKAIYNQESVKLDKKHLNLVHGCLIENGIQENEELITLQEKQSSEIRWLVVSYLNSLESVLSAWHYGIADEEIIETEFSYLVSPTKGYFILEKFRRASGGVDSYPAIQAFVDKISKKKPVSRGKSKVA